MLTETTLRAAPEDLEKVCSTLGGEKPERDEPPSDPKPKRDEDDKQDDLDEELEESFPASDPPSRTQP